MAALALLAGLWLLFFVGLWLWLGTQDAGPEFDIVLPEDED